MLDFNLFLEQSPYDTDGVNIYSTSPQRVHWAVVHCDLFKREIIRRLYEDDETIPVRIIEATGKTLVLQNVDLELLEKQRMELIALTDKVARANINVSVLNGLQNMLDAWADERGGV